MGKSKGGIYAVARGRVTGCFNTWAECEKQVKGFPGGRYKKFSTRAEAEAFVAGGELGYAGGSANSQPTTSGGPQWFDAANGTSPAPGPRTAPSAPTTPSGKSRGPCMGCGSEKPCGRDFKLGDRDVIYIPSSGKSVATYVLSPRKNQHGEIIEDDSQDDRLSDSDGISDSDFSSDSDSGDSVESDRNRLSPGPQSRIRKRDDSSDEYAEPPRAAAKLKTEGRYKADRPKTALLPSDDEQDFSARSRPNKENEKPPPPNELINVWCDGSALGNGKAGARAGWGVYFGEPGKARYAHLNEGGRLAGEVQTNNRGELQVSRARQAISECSTRAHTDSHSTPIKAIVRACVLTPPSVRLRIHTDSRYSIDCIDKWQHGWRRNGWRLSSGGQVQNRDLIERIEEEFQKKETRPTLLYVAGHSGDVGNEAADK